MTRSFLATLPKEGEIQKVQRKNRRFVLVLLRATRFHAKSREPGANQLLRRVLNLLPADQRFCCFDSQRAKVRRLPGRIVIHNPEQSI